LVGRRAEVQAPVLLAQEPADRLRFAHQQHIATHVHNIGRPRPPKKGFGTALGRVPAMIAAYAEKLGLPDFLDGLVVGEYHDPDPPAGWVVAGVKAASLNPHDTWTLKGQVGFPFEPPVVLGCDGAGLAPDGTEVVFYPVIPTKDGGLRMLTDGVDGTFAPKVALPAANLVRKPANLSFEEAAGLGTAWLTAYRMLFTKARLRPGERVLIQGASGGVSTAAIMLASRAGAHVTVTSRKEEALEKARGLGAHDGVPSGGKLAKRVDVVIET